jgi:hypothetical protein
MLDYLLLLYSNFHYLFSMFVLYIFLNHHHHYFSNMYENLSLDLPRSTILIIAVFFLCRPCQSLNGFIASPRPLVHLEAEKEEKVDSSMNETQVLRVHSTKEIAIQNHATQYAIDRHNLQTVESAGGEVAQRKGRKDFIW